LPRRNDENKKTSLIIGGGVLALAAVFAVYWISSGFFMPVRMIELPNVTPRGEQPTGGAPVTAEQPSAQQTPIIRMEVNAENLISVLREMERAGTYSATVAAEQHWPGGSAVNRHSIYHQNGMTKIERYDSAGNIYYNKLYSGGRTYTWGDGPPVYGSDNDPVDSDSAAGMPSYEDLLKIDRGQILDAGFVVADGRPFIYAEWFDTVSGYRCQFWISADFNLLEKAVIYDGTELAYTMSFESIPSRNVDESKFLLPVR
jgi:hypothetical protein